jgi:hypothetical protein
MSSRACTCAGPDNRIRQLQPVVSPDGDRAVGDLRVEFDQPEVVQKITCWLHQGGRGADQHLHPRYHADRCVVVARQFGLRCRNTAQEVDQDVGIEKDLHHSARMRA